MRTYYLFQIKKESMDHYQNHPEALYQLLYHLYHLPISEGRYGFQCYMQLCIPFDTTVLTDYIEGKYQIKKSHKQFSFPEGNLIQVGASTCMVRTSSNFPAIFRMFYYYSRDIFVIDFANHDYFWLTKHYHEIRKPEYNKIGVEKMCNI